MIDYGRATFKCLTALILFYGLSDSLSAEICKLRIECDLVEVVEEPLAPKPLPPVPIEVPFVRAEFPIVLEPNPETGQDCFISFPIERVKESGCLVSFQLLVEEWEQRPAIDPNNARHMAIKNIHMSLTMQAVKRSQPAGFCASVRTLPVGKPTESTLNYTSKPPERFYASIHVPYWVKRVTILGVEVEGHRFIEARKPATPEERVEIRELISRLGDDHYAHRHQAHLTLVKTGSAAVDDLLEFREDEDPERRVRVQQILAEIDKLEQLRLPPDETQR